MKITTDEFNKIFRENFDLKAENEKLKELLISLQKEYDKLMLQKLGID